MAHGEIRRGSSRVAGGEAGIGKSRLIRAIVDEITKEPIALIRYQCSQNYRDSAFWPIVARFLADSGIVSEEPDSEKNSKLLRVLENSVPDDPAVMPLVAALIGIENADEARVVANLPPKFVVPERWMR